MCERHISKFWKIFFKKGKNQTEDRWLTTHIQLNVDPVTVQTWPMAAIERRWWPLSVVEMTSPCCRWFVSSGFRHTHCHRQENKHSKGSVVTPSIHSQSCAYLLIILSAKSPSGQELVRLPNASQHPSDLTRTVSRNGVKRSAGSITAGQD